MAKYVDGLGWLGMTWNEIDETAWLFSDVVNGNTFTNDLELERDGNLLRIRINGTPLGTYVDPLPLAGGYYGLINWSSQLEEARANFDNYRVVTWDDGGFSGQQNVVSRPSSGQVPQTPTGDLLKMKRLEGVQKVEE
ncbi:MAG: hypothetical protein R2867_18490 [Caldilineaceae bacterium]